MHYFRQVNGNCTTSSFSVNPGAKERLVQITGANEESIK